MNRYLIEVKKLKKTFDHRNGQVKVFQDVNLGIKPGELVALVGPSGSGKSSFLHLLALLESPSAGKVLFLGKDSKNFNEDKKNQIRREKISIIFQDNNLLSDFTTVENVLMPLIIRGENYESSFKKAKNILKQVNLSERINHFPSELSGGEQQRVAIARSIIAETDLVLADEPTGNLDKESGINILNILKELNDQGKTVIMITHNQEHANMFKKVIELVDGKIVKNEKKKTKN